MIALDTNLLVYAHRAWAPEHSRAVDAIQKAAAAGPFAIPQPCLAEFWFTVTRANVDGRPSTPDEAYRFLNALCEGGGRLLSAPPSLPRLLLEESRRMRISGTRIFDLQVALSAREGGAKEMWTADRAFPRLSGLAVINPL